MLYRFRKFCEIANVPRVFYFFLFLLSLMIREERDNILIA